MFTIDEYVCTGKSVYGVTALTDYLSGKVCCSVHKTVSDVIGDAYTGVEGKVGTHPALREAALGLHGKCRAMNSVLHLDRQFLLGAITFSLPGFQFRSDRVLPHLRKFETGTVMGLSAFGTGYCYLGLFREAMRFRVARILGPVPYIADVCLMYRVAGLSRHSYAIRAAGQGFFHCELVNEVFSGKDTNSALIGLVEMDAKARIGVARVEYCHCFHCCEMVDPVGHVCDGVRRDEEDKGKGVKVWCDKCQCNVKPEGHYFRCRPKVSRSISRELVGDALHALDVKMALAYAAPVGTHLTEVAKDFVSSSSQRAYLERLEPEALPHGCSDRRWSNLFESRYSEQFRWDYLHWFEGELMVRFGNAMPYLFYYQPPEVKKGRLSFVARARMKVRSFLFPWLRAV